MTTTTALAVSAAATNNRSASRVLLNMLEDARASHLMRLVEDMISDVRYALRTVARSPGFALTAMLSLALGLGANSAVFSLVDAVLLQTLPVRRPGELVFLQAAGTDGRRGAPPYPCFERIRDRSPGFAGIAAFAADELRVDVDGAPEQVYGQVASGSYFDVLGLTPAAGRLLTAADEELTPAVAVIGHGYWQRRFGGSPDAIGRTIGFRDRVFTIVGVTPPEFRGLQPGRQIDVTLPIALERGMLSNAGAWWFDAIARLQPGTTVEQARVQADAVFQSFIDERGGSAEIRRKHFDHLELTPASRGLDRLRARFSMPLYVLTLVAGVVLLIACANLAHLQLARGAARSREFGVRLAAGARPGRLLRQLLTETLLLFLVGAGAGLLVARAAVDVLTGFFAVGRNPIVLDARVNWRQLAFAAAVALAAGLLTGLWPAIRALRTDAQAALKDGDGRTAGSRRALTAGRALASAQVALSLVLLVACGMFVQTLMNLRAQDLGFNPAHVLTMSLDPFLPQNAGPAARAQFMSGALDQARRVPGVRAASLSVLTPLSGRDTGRDVSVRGYQPREETDRAVRVNHVSEDYFRTFGIELLAGRAFTATDDGLAARVAIINEATAREYFGARNPLDEILDFGRAGSYRIIGIVRDHKHRSVREAVPRFVFVPIRQPVDPITRVTLAVLSEQAPAALARTVGEEVRAVHPKTLVSDVIGVEQQIDATLVSERLLSTLASAFAALAAGLAAIGLYGILSCGVARRRTEFGIRMALGAPRARVAADVFRDVMIQVGVGLALGLPLAMTIARVAEQMLFGVSPAAPASYVVGAGTLAAIAGLAAWVPAWRASSIDPSEALRRQ